MKLHLGWEPIASNSTVRRPHDVNADIKNNTDVFYLSASNKIHQGMFDNGLLEDTCIGLSFKSY